MTKERKNKIKYNIIFITNSFSNYSIIISNISFFENFIIVYILHVNISKKIHYSKNLKIVKKLK